MCIDVRLYINDQLHHGASVCLISSKVTSEFLKGF